MKVLKGLICLILVFLLTGCEDDDPKGVATLYPNPEVTNGGSKKSTPAETSYHDNRDVSTDSPPAQGGGSATITLVNNSSVTIYFTVNGDTKSVTPGQSRSWSYQGTAHVSTTISGSFWSQSWNDGLNHSYVARDNGIPEGFDLN
jgi:hypothetical protein